LSLKSIQIKELIAYLTVKSQQLKPNFNLPIIALKSHKFGFRITAQICNQFPKFCSKIYSHNQSLGSPSIHNTGKKNKFPSPSQASHEEHQRGLEIFPDFNLPYQHHLHPNRHYNSLLIKPATSPLKEINPDIKHHRSSLTNHQTISQPRHHPSHPFIRQKKKTPLEPPSPNPWRPQHCPNSSSTPPTKNQHLTTSNSASINCKLWTEFRS